MQAIYLQAGDGPDLTLTWVLYTGLGFMLLIVVIGWLAGLDIRSRPKAKRKSVDRKGKNAKGNRKMN